MNRILRTCTLLAGAAGLAAVAGCAGNPAGPDQAPAAVVAEPTTGSNIPRRDRKAGVANVTTMSGEAAKDITNKSQAPAVRN